MDDFTFWSEFDALLDRVDAWIEQVPRWHAAEVCRNIVASLRPRLARIRSRAVAPLIVATLGGTGTGKSTLINALVGEEVVPSGRERPTTRKPIVVCSPEVDVHTLSLPLEECEIRRATGSILNNAVLIDCPDPDSCDSAEDAAGNLARLRRILPECDVILVTATQQKYRNAAVAAESAKVAVGAKLILVQTHAAIDDDVRDDWKARWKDKYGIDEIYFVDSIQAFADRREGKPPQGDFARLRSQLEATSGVSAVSAIRKANALDLLDDVLRRCASRIERDRPALDTLRNKLDEVRTAIGKAVSAELESELRGNAYAWQQRVLSEVVQKWGWGVFPLLVRLYANLGGLLSGAALMRARTITQAAIVGAVGTAQNLRRRLRGRAELPGLESLKARLRNAGIRQAAWSLDGYLSDCGLDLRVRRSDHIENTLEQSAAEIARCLSVATERIAADAAVPLTRWWRRIGYELLLDAMAGVLLFRLGSNFFYESWLAENATALLGWDIYLLSLFWFLLWGALLVGGYVTSLGRTVRRCLRRKLDEYLSDAWKRTLFDELERELNAVDEFCATLDRLQTQARSLRRAGEAAH
ncbi:hypothetical protein JCM19992_28400 [Thermostilla marina]